jgi:hypothetical protein
MLSSYRIAKHEKAGGGQHDQPQNWLKNAILSLLATIPATSPNVNNVQISTTF